MSLAYAHPQRMEMSAYGNVLVRSPFPLTGKGRDRGVPNDQSITPTLLLPRQRLCRNVILRSGATKNLLFCSFSFGTQRGFGKSTEEKQILRYRQTV
jgi:hypothetical protein